VLVLLALLACAACDVTIATGLSDAEARELSAALNREGIAVTTEREGYTEPRYQLSIAPGAVPRAVTALRAGPAAMRDAAEPAMPLLPTRSAERAADARARAQQLTRALEQLPGVRKAAVQVQLQEGAPGLRDLLRPSAGASASAHIALVRAADARLDADHVRALAASLVPGLAPSAVQLNEQPEAVGCAPCAELSHLGDVTLTRASLGTLKLWLGASLLAHMLTASTLLVLLHRRRSRAASERER